MLEFIEIIRNKLILVVILSRRLALVVYGAVEGFHGPVVVCGPSSSGAWPWSRRSHRGWIPAETPTLPPRPCILFHRYHDNVNSHAHDH